jgi:hypothetical protein
MSYLIRAAVKSHDPTQSFVTVLHYVYGPTTDASVEDFLTGFVGTITTGLRATLISSGQLDSVDATRIPDPGSGDTPDEATLVLNLAGTYGPGGDDIPQALCGLVNLKTNVASRRARGWTYGFPMWRSTALSSSGEVINPASDYWTGLGTLATGLAASAVGDTLTYDPVVFSRVAYDTEAPNWYFGINAAVRSSKPRWLRKRSLIH